MTIRKISDETHRALKARARQHGRSAEAEVRAILDEAVSPQGRIRVGSLLSDIAHDSGGVELGIVRNEQAREAVDFS